MFRMLLAALVVITAAAQTRVDLRTQSQGVDFTAATATKPIKAGTALPGQCAIGEMFFKTDAPSGANVYGCTAANTWSVLGTSVTVASDGTVVGQRSQMNFTTGPGLLSLTADTGSEVDILWSLDTAVVQTQAGEQSGRALLCASASGSAVHYQCSLNPTLGAYVSGMTLHWKPDVNGSGGPTTLNIDTLGAMPVKLSDGASNPGATDIVAGALYNIWYDGTQFRLLTSLATGGSGSLGYTAENVANKGVANGYAALDSSAHLPTANTSAITGDVTKAAGNGAATVTGIQGRAVATTAPADGQALIWSASASQYVPGAAGGGGGGLRTWNYIFQGASYGGVPVFTGNLPAAGAPTAKLNASGDLAVLDFPAAQSSSYWYGSWRMPPAYPANGAISYVISSMCDPANCDSTHAANVYISLACSGISARADSASYTELTSPVAITNNASGNMTISAGTITPGAGTPTLPACATTNRATIKLRVDTAANSLSGSFQLVAVSFYVQGQL